MVAPELGDAMRIHLCILLGALSLTACKSGVTVEDSDTGEEVVDDGQSPTLSEPSAKCVEHPDGEGTVDLWNFQVLFDDPQGTEDVPRNLFSEADVDDQHHIEWLRDGNMVDQAGVVACDPDGGTCTGSFPGASYGLTCATATDWRFRFVIKDYDGNEGTIEVQGAKG